MSEPTSKGSASWLRLELHALGELPADQADDVAADLDRDPESRRCLDRIRSDRRDLRPLPVLAADPGPWSPRWSRLRRHFYLVGAPVAVAAAIVLLVIARDQPERSGALPGPRIQVKGGDVAIALVRERGGVIAHDPRDYAAGDRFKVLLTCPPDRRLRGEVQVLQGGDTASPLPSVDLACGNRVPVPGAFTLTGAAPAAVCFTFTDTPADGPAHKARKPAVCTPLTPSP